MSARSSRFDPPARKTGIPAPARPAPPANAPGAPTAPTGRRRYRRATRIAAAVAATLLALATGELAIRLLRVAPQIRPIVLSDEHSVYRRSDNPILGYELKPAYRNDAPDLVTSYPFTNAHGQRDVERTVEKPTGVRRVLLLGDSVVEGEGIRELDQTIGRQLEALDPDGKTEVLNFGVSGYCTLAEVELLEVKGLKFAPDVVVVVFVENDFDNFNLQLVELASRARRPGWATALFRGLHLFRLLCIRFNLFDFGAEADPASWNRAAVGDNNVVEGLNRLAALSARHGFEPILAVWPQFLDDRIVDPHEMPDGSGNLIVERLARANGIRTVRLSDAFRRHQAATPEAANPRLYYTARGDGMHPNPRACRVAAEALHDALAQPATRPAPGPRPPAEPSANVLAAIEAARSRGTRKPDLSAAALNAGRVLLDQGNLDGAIAQFRRALELRPDLAEAHVNLGSALAGRGELDAAETHLRRGVELLPESGEARFNLARVLELRGRHEDAVEQYRAALRTRPDEPDAHVALGAALRALGRTDEALAQFREALRVNPDYVPALGSLATVLAERGELPAAAQHFARILQLDPDSAAAHFSLGNVLAMQGDLDGAVAHFEQAVRLRPEFAEAHLRLANALRRQGRLDDAIASYRRALAAAPDSAEAHYRLSEALTLAGRQGEAIPSLREALRLAPDWPPALNDLAWVLATHPDEALRDPTEAVRLAELAAARSEQRDPNILDTLAAALAAAGRFDEAVAAGQSAIDAARAAGASALAERIAARVALYRERRAYLQAPAPPATTPAAEP